MLKHKKNEPLNRLQLVFCLLLIAIVQSRFQEMEQ